MDEAGKQAVLGALRTALTALGGILGTKGWVNSADVELYVGAFIVIAGAAWSIWDKYHTETKAQARETVAVNAGRALADATEGPTPVVQAASVKSVIATFGANAPPQP